MEQIINTISGWVWSPALVAICLLAGLYFSVGTRFVQVRRFREMARLLFSTDHSQKTGITSFQAFSMALSGRVGTGNIVGPKTIARIQEGVTSLGRELSKVSLC